MTAFTKFNPRVFRDERRRGPEPAKPANPAKAEAGSEQLSSFSGFSGEVSGPAAIHPDELAPVAAVRSGEWSTDDWQAFFDERTGIAEFDGRLPLAEAEARAIDCCVAEWLTRHPVPSPPGRCAWCSGTGLSGAVVVPFGTESGNHTWLHSNCWPAWHAARRAAAIAALAAMGIDHPRTHR